jgi:hypothetical protein
MGQINMTEINYAPSASERFFILFLLVAVCIVLVRITRMAWLLWSVRRRQEFLGFRSRVSASFGNSFAPGVCHRAAMWRSKVATERHKLRQLQVALVSAESDLIRMRNAMLANVINLHCALGGGFEQPGYTTYQVRFAFPKVRSVGDFGHPPSREQIVFSRNSQ